LHDACAISVHLRKLSGKQIVELETDNATGASSQFGGGGARTGADFQNAIAQVGAT